MMEVASLSSVIRKKADVKINPDYRWACQDMPYGRLDYRGDESLKISASIAGIEQSDSFSGYCAAVMDVLARQEKFCSGILSTGIAVIAWVDHIRSYPVFYGGSDDESIVSNDARFILSALGDRAVEDEVSALEFSMAGFVTGQDTLFKNIKCLQPGEFLIWLHGERTPYVGRYFQYIPVPDSQLDWNGGVQSLNGIIDRIICDIIERANGRPIWIPLSAGLDSRIILCKLHEHGYKNLHSFTYGPALNFESLYAHRTARTLNVPWHFVYISGRKARRDFESVECRRYLDYADGLKAAPSMREYTAVKYLKDRNIIHRDAIVINGQSGDYISGGHVSEHWYKHETSTINDLVRLLIDKHYDLWRNLKSQENEHTIRDKIVSLLPKTPETAPSEKYAVLEETWEYDARQIVLVVNGQRSYDFFGYDWELPLWEKALVEFFRHVPYVQKRRQALFKRYLTEYNYKGLFPEKEPQLWRWPLPMLWVLVAAKIVDLCGKGKKEKFYAFMRYWGHYSNQYAFFPLSEHKKTYADARNVFSLYVRHWFEGNNYPLKSETRKAMRLDG